MDNKIVRVHNKLIEEITDYKERKYGGGISFTQASLNYAVDMKRLREQSMRSKETKRGSNFL